MKSVESKDKITDQLDSFLNKINKIFLSQATGKNVAFLQENQARASSSHVLSLLNFVPENRLENILKQIIYEYAIKAEKISSDSAVSMLSFLLDFFDKKRKNPAFDLVAEKQKIIEDIQQNLKRPTGKSYREFIRSNFSTTIGDVASEAYNLAGPAGKIVFDHGNISQPIVELARTYQFEIQPEINILLANEGTWEKTDVKVFCIEGIIEKVSEIDCILSEAARKKSRVLIVSLGNSHEVVSTILTNNARKVFDISLCYPVNDRTSINDIFDIATVSSATLFDYQNPISISFKPECFDNTCEEVSMVGNKLFIKNSKAPGIANKKVKQLREKLGESDIEDDYIRKRIQSLTANQVKITLPEKTSQEKFNEIERLDKVLRSIKSFVKYGTYKNKYLSSSVYVGCTYAYDLYEILSSIEAAIVYE